MAEITAKQEEFDFGNGITIEDQFALRCAIVNEKTGKKIVDFFDVQTFDGIVFDEVAGGRLPMVRLSFTAVSDGVFKFLNQGNILKVSISSLAKNNADEENQLSKDLLQDFEISSLSIKTKGNLKVVDIVGVLNKLSFLKDNRVKIHKSKDSRRVIKDIVSDYFETDFPETDNLDDEETKPPEDSQNWVQVDTDENFIQHVLLHTNYPNSFPIVAVSSFGKYRYRNFLPYVSSSEIPYKYRFVSSFQPMNNFDDEIPEITHAGDILDISNAYMLNLWRSCGVVLPVYDMDMSVHAIPYEGRVELGALTGKKYSNVHIDTKPINMPPAYQSDNVYPEFYAAKSRNLMGFSMYSSQKLKFSFRKSFIPIEVLDLIFMVNETSMNEDNTSDDVANEDAQNKGSSSSNTGSEGIPPRDPHTIDNVTSGRYIISRLTRNFTIGGVSTTIECCREFHPEQLGNLVGTEDNEETVDEEVE